jgi:hypothetical protein
MFHETHEQPVWFRAAAEIFKKMPGTMRGRQPVSRQPLAGARVTLPLTRLRQVDAVQQER